MNFININRKTAFQGQVIQSSGSASPEQSANNVVTDTSYWTSRKNQSAGNEFFIIDYQKSITIDYIQLTPSPNGVRTFPKHFRIEYSLDGKSWHIIHTENDYILESGLYTLDFPYLNLRYLKIFIIETENINAQYYIEIAKCIAGISGLHTISASSQSASEKTPYKLIDGNPETYWESELSDKPSKESILLDIGKISPITNVILSSAANGFPNDFSIEISTDDEIWIPLLEEKNFIAQTKQVYFWQVKPTLARFVRLKSQGVQLGNNTYGLRIAGFELSVMPSNTISLSEKPPVVSYASIFQAGIVKLAKDGENIQGSAVQSNDRRLRDASTIFKGIVQFAEDGEDKEGLVVQASDSRLKNASELNPGIVRLGYDRENNPGCVVQCNDSRLQEANTDNYGIVKLCPDGLYTELGVVKGNDSRLQKATLESYGICRLAKNGETSSGAVVQANDNRLRDATTYHKGVVELAENGEDKEGVAVQGNDKRLRDATESSKGIVELAESGEDKPGLAVQGNDSRLKDASTTSKGIVELAEDGEERPGIAVQANDHRLRDATTEIRGIVKLANDGENHANVAVQGNDKRLRDATVMFKGIVELAEDGEDAEGVVVQGNDKRLRDATTLTKGIVELAENGEDQEGLAVQAHDKRLKDATTTSKGIVELADDGEDKPGSVVQANDSRLKDATESSKGIVRFATNGSCDAEAAVQGNDRRLRNATTTSPGIVELAEDGEDKPGVAVQANDKRLKMATTTTPGIIELAEDGEDKPGVAVQANDKRLLDATEDQKGIVQLAANNESRAGYAVQSNDERLNNSRIPLPHEHDYAPKNHEFNSHNGTISIKAKKNDLIKEITPPTDDSSLIHANNASTKSGSIGISGIAGTTTEKQINAYGVFGHSTHIGVRGQSTGHDSTKGCGIMGISRFGAGGVFASEHDYSLVVEGFGRVDDYDTTTKLKGNGDALKVKGRSSFDGKLEIQNKSDDEQSNPINIVEYFEVDESEYIAAGDLLVAHSSGNAVLTRSRDAYNKAVIGTVSGNPTICINNSGEETKIYPVTLAGKTLCKIDAREKPINPGDLIVTSATPGCGMAGTIDSFNKIGTVIGKALDSLQEGIGIISIFVCHQ